MNISSLLRIAGSGLGTTAIAADFSALTSLSLLPSTGLMLLIGMAILEKDPWSKIGLCFSEHPAPKAKTEKPALFITEEEAREREQRAYRQGQVDMLRRINDTGLAMLGHEPTKGGEVNNYFIHTTYLTINNL